MFAHLDHLEYMYSEWTLDIPKDAFSGNASSLNRMQITSESQRKSTYLVSDKEPMIVFKATFFASANIPLS